MKVQIPKAEALAFGRTMASGKYLEDERRHKDAVHEVLSVLLSPATLDRSDFPKLIASVFGEAIPDLDALGLAREAQERVRGGLGGVGGTLRAAMANLAGGKWGLAQFAWFPRAVEFGLGPEFTRAFRGLVDETAPLHERIEKFRDDCEAISTELEKLGGFLPNWRHFRESLSFVAVLLGGIDPTRYTFYAKGALRHGFERYAPGTAWPTGTMGQVYEGVCEFVRAVSEELKLHGVPVKDLIDAQSFIWMSFAAADVRPWRVPPPGPVPPPEPKPTEATMAEDLAAAVHWPLPRARGLIDLAQRSRQLLFQGPPGTGKTFVAKELAGLLAGDDEGRVEVVQFHPSYAYEDFVEGIRPVVTKSGGNLAYEVRPGVFLRLVHEAKESPDSRFFLVIDEINRANLPRVFGELLYALEYRGPDHPFRLPYSGLMAHVPENLVVIATMNSADRSIALVDAAIRRRFRHVEFRPDPEVLSAWLVTNGQEGVAADAARRLTALNDALVGLLDADRLIGHTYLMRPDLEEVGFGTVWEEDLVPVLREHLYNRADEIDGLRRVFVGD